MDTTALLLVAIGLALVAFLAAFAYAALMRMRGRRSRFDAVFETMVRAQGASVFPPSLRGDPDQPAIESTEDSRAANASRDAPNAPR
jgi:hypothetical protein